MALSREALARRLVQLREAHDPPLTQADAAKLIGISERQYARWESRDGTPYFSSIQKVARAYNISPQELLIDPNDQTTPTPTTNDDLARLEAKIDLILEHLNLDPTTAQPGPPDDPFR